LIFRCFRNYKQKRNLMEELASNREDPRSPAAIFPTHFHSLDGLRGVAALSVVFSHWQHFFFHGTELTHFAPEQQPLYSLFSFLYSDGWRAVDLFFCLSGFIFYWLYSEKISRREASPRDFFVLRFSRLYPLHFVTLLFVAAGQLLMMWSQGAYFVYPCNDLLHFGLQTVFASDWGFTRGNSFNGPIWSVSVEILLYLVFLFTSLFNIRRLWQLALLSFCGSLLIQFGNQDVGRGAISFFIGGIVYGIFVYLSRLNPSRASRRCLGVFAMLMWIFIPLNSQHNLLYRIYRTRLWSERMNWRGKDVAGHFLLLLPSFSFEFFLFPLTILALALWEAKCDGLSKRWAFLGQISYSSYLLQFPLQMVIAGIAITAAVPKTFFNTGFSLFIFFGILIPLSWCSYQMFERPVQTWIRGWAIRRGLVVQAAPVS